MRSRLLRSRFTKTQRNEGIAKRAQTEVEGHQKEKKKERERNKEKGKEIKRKEEGSAVRLRCCVVCTGCVSVQATVSCRCVLCVLCVGRCGVSQCGRRRTPPNPKGAQRTLGSVRTRLCTVRSRGSLTSATAKARFCMISDVLPCSSMGALQAKSRVKSTAEGYLPKGRSSGRCPSRSLGQCPVPSVLALHARHVSRRVRIPSPPLNLSSPCHRRQRVLMAGGYSKPST